MLGSFVNNQLFHAATPDVFLHKEIIDSIRCTRIQIERNLNTRIKLKRKKIWTKFFDNPSNKFISFFFNSIFYTIY